MTEAKPTVHRTSRKRGPGQAKDVDLPPSVADLKSVRCRKCQRNRALKDYYLTTDPEWDTNGHYSICRYCIDEAYERYFVAEKSLDRAILRLCRVLNAKYDGHTLEALKKEIATIEGKGKAVAGVFGLYRKNLTTSGGERGFALVDDLTYQEGVKYEAPYIDPSEYGEGVIEEIVKFWGEGMSADEYNFLESELARYKKTHKCDTAAEESLLRQICFCELDIRKARMAGGPPSKSAIDTLQGLMKTASVDPAKTAIAGAGKSQDTFSAFIKTIEENEPADYYKDKKLFKDFDNLEFYFKKYVTRPLKNFITLSRDFNVDKDEDEDEEFDLTEADEG